ncbi:EKC/KEOPS complex subunit LAGE3-like [Talpa occidentalis]|uniref:EKC/KEOPS complex subunit LAGE3-like n=1 Tax=Talpa occidentalis TaxID=50954 RepID=UPI00188F6C5D|nr:EKC/KEOPS complex subunit LAGE3-like [Talpa occidentalis]
MQSPDAGAQGADEQPQMPQGADGQGSLGAGSGAARAPQAPGPAGGAAPVAVASGPESKVLQCTLRVPFLSPLDANVACWFLTPEVEPRVQLVRKDLSVVGSDLVVVMTSEELCFLQISIDAFLDQLFLVTHIIHRSGSF